MPFGFFFSIVANLVKSVVLGMLVRGFLASKKNPCYFCDICGHFEASPGFFFSKVVNLINLLFLRFCDICKGCFKNEAHTNDQLYQFLFKLIQLAYTLLLLRYLPTFRGLSWLLLFHYLVTFSISAISAS